MPLKKRRRPLSVFKDPIKKRGITYKQVADAIGRSVRSTENILNGYSIPQPIEIKKLNNFVSSIIDLPEKEKKKNISKGNPAVNKNCFFCGKNFSTTKSTKISCSDSCYQKHYRERNKKK